MARSITVQLPREETTTYPVLEMLVVHCNDDGRTVITCDSHTAARLAGRDIFGHVAETQAALKDAIRDNWYSNRCPSTA